MDTRKNTKKNKAREQYIKNISVITIAEKLKLSPRTVYNYKKEDLKHGIDWDSLRQADLITENRTSGTILSNFETLLKSTLEQLEESEEITDSDKIAAITRLGDAYLKMQKVGKKEDPQAFTLGIIKKTTITILETLNKYLDQHVMTEVIKILESPETQKKLQLIKL